MSISRFDASIEEIKARREETGDGLSYCKHIFRQNNMLREIDDIRNRASSGLPVEGKICDLLEILVQKMLP